MNPLSNLNDITTPDNVSAWPLAWGWWVLIALVLAITLLVIWQSLRYVSTQRARKLALVELKHLNAQTNPSVSDYNALLKRVAIAYTSRNKVAQLHGESWQQFLFHALPDSKQASSYQQALKQFTEALYAPQSSTSDASNVVEYWLKNVSLSRLVNSDEQGANNV